MLATRHIAWGIGLAACAAGALGFLAAPRPVPRAAPVRTVPKRAHPAPPRPAPKPTPAPYVIRRILDTGGPIAYGKWFWDETGVPAGPVVITIDTAAEVLSIFRAGYEIGTTAVIYGADQKPTPLGVFPVLMKDANHFSSTYGRAPMPYTLRLTNDGVSIHGSKIDASYATHGCIGVPIAFAKKLFAAVKLGDTVIVTRGETLALGGAVKAAR